MAGWHVAMNPDNIDINSVTEITTSIKIFTIQGKMIFNQELNLSKGLNNKMINLNEYTKGLYFLKIGDKTQKLIIQ